MDNQLKIKKQLAIKGYISEQQFVEYSKNIKNIKSKQKNTDLFIKFKNMPPPDRNDKRKYEF